MLTVHLDSNQSHFRLVFCKLNWWVGNVVCTKHIYRKPNQLLHWLRLPQQWASTRRMFSALTQIMNISKAFPCQMALTTANELPTYMPSQMSREDRSKSFSSVSSIEKA